MAMDVIAGILIPFLGTSLGAAMVFVLKKNVSEGLQKILTGFAAGVMVAAPIWSMIVPAMEKYIVLRSLTGAERHCCD